MSRTHLSWNCRRKYRSKLLSTISIASSNEMRSIYDTVTDSSGSITKKYAGKLRFLGNLLSKNGLTFLPTIEIDYPAKVNYPKDLSYLRERSLLKKWGIGKESIISLAGARPYHISLFLEQQTGIFRTFVLFEKDFEQLAPYCFSLNQLGKINFILERKNILEFMKTTTEKYQVIDLDLCAKLSSRVDNIVEAVEHCADRKILLGITHTMRGYKGLKKKDVFIARKQLLKKLSEKFDILDGEHTYYWNSISMFRESLILQRKAA